jgi:creatinine amidohydrolase
MEKEIRIECMTWPEILKAMEAGYDAILIFTGSVEQHGLHLPLLTDTILGYALGERVARKLGNTLLAPVIRPGISEHHMKFKGTVSLSEEVFKGTVRDYVRSYARHGFRRIIVTWSHGGNAKAISEVLPELAAELPNVEILGHADTNAFFKDWMSFAAQRGVDLERLGIHAGEGETSCMLAVVPEQVRKDQLAQGFMGDLVNPQGAHAKLLQDGLHTLTENGILGDARHVDAERGAAYLEMLADHYVANFKRVQP